MPAGLKIVERGWCCGLRQQEAPQAAAEDARTAAEQEVTNPAPSGRRPSGRPAAGAGPASGRDFPRGPRAQRPRSTPTGGTVRLPAVAGVLRDAAGPRGGAAGRSRRSWPPAAYAVAGGQVAVPWGSRMAGPSLARPPRTATTAEGLRHLAGSVLRLAEGQLPDEGPVDEFGFDPAFNSRYLMPVARFFYQRWFRVRIRGMAHVPATGGAEPAAAGRGPGLRDPAAVRPGPQGRARPRGAGERGRAAAGRPARRRL